MTFQLEQN